MQKFLTPIPGKKVGNAASAHADEPGCREAIFCRFPLVAGPPLRYLIVRFRRRIACGCVMRRGAGVVERGGLENRCAPWAPWVRIPPSPPFAHSSFSHFAAGARRTVSPVLEAGLPSGTCAAPVPCASCPECRAGRAHHVSAGADAASRQHVRAHRPMICRRCAFRHPLP